MNGTDTYVVESADDFKTTLGLNNVTNESKETMFNNPTFTGDRTILQNALCLTNGNGINITALTGDLLLTINDATYHKLDANGSNRNVLLVNTVFKLRNNKQQKRVIKKRR